jgi:hypothetical protein
MPRSGAGEQDKSILQVGLSLALLTFACLAFGQTATNQFAGTAELDTYFGSTAVILILVSLMPPNRPTDGLVGRAERSRQTPESALS